MKGTIDMSKMTADWYLEYCKERLYNLPADADARGVGYWTRRITLCINIITGK